MRGFQLWINLPASDKMIEPRYQDVESEGIRTIERADGSRIKIVNGIDSAVRSAATDSIHLDVQLPAGSHFHHELPADHAAFIYVFDGCPMWERARRQHKSIVAILRFCRTAT